METQKRYRVLLNTYSISKANLKEYDTYIDFDNRSILSVGGNKDADLLLEYDGIIIDTDFFLNNQIFETNTRIEQIKHFIKRSNSIMIFLIGKYQKSNNGWTNYIYIRQIINEIFNKNIDILFDTVSSGSKAYGTKFTNISPFREYLKTKSTNWSISFLGQYSEHVLPLLNAENGNLIAFTPKQFLNKIFFLPWIPQKEEIFFSELIELVRNSSLEYETVPDWTRKYFVPSLKEKIDKINEIEVRIDECNKEKEKIVTGKDEIEKIRDTLLFRDGMVLQNVVKDVLNYLGLNSNDGTQGREDIIFIYNKNHFVIEVKGSKKSASYDNIKQLHSHMVQYEEDEQEKSKGILIINAWRELPIENRNTPDTLIFPTQIDKSVKIWGIALLTTQQLFVAYCQKLENKFNTEEFVKKLFNTVGAFDGLNNISDYKEKESIA